MSHPLPHPTTNLPTNPPTHPPVLSQYGLVQFGGDFVKTTPLTSTEWYQSVVLGAVTLPLGVVMRFIPVTEDMSDYAGTNFAKPSSDAKKNQ